MPRRNRRLNILLLVLAIIGLAGSSVSGSGCSCCGEKTVEPLIAQITYRDQRNSLSLSYKMIVESIRKFKLGSNISSINIDLGKPEEVVEPTQNSYGYTRWIGDSGFGGLNGFEFIVYTEASGVIRQVRMMMPSMRSDYGDWLDACEKALGSADDFGLMKRWAVWDIGGGNVMLLNYDRSGKRLILWSMSARRYREKGPTGW